MSIGGGSSGEKGTQKSEPWDQQIPYLLKAFGEADRLYGGNPATGATAAAPIAAARPTASAGATGPNAKLEPWQTPWSQGGDYIRSGDFLKNPNAAYMPNYNAMLSEYLRTKNTAPAASPTAASNPATTPGAGGIVGQYYPGSTVAGLSGQTQAANDLIMRKALAGEDMLSRVTGDLNKTVDGAYLDPNSNPWSSLTMNTARGDFLNSNPYLDAMYGVASRNVQGAFKDATRDTQSAFAKSGRYGSNALFDAEGRREEKLTQGLNDLGTEIYYQNYNDERDRMEAAQGRGLDAYGAERNRMLDYARLAPELEEARYIGADKLAESGKYMDDYMQDLVNADIDRWDYDQAKPYEALKRYLGLIQGDYGGTTSSKSKSSKFGFSIPLIG